MSIAPMPRPSPPAGLSPSRFNSFRLAWSSMDQAERAALGNELARAEEGFLIAFHSARSAHTPWLEGLAIMALASTYRLQGHDLPEWLSQRAQDLATHSGECRVVLDLVEVVSLTPQESPHLRQTIEDLRSVRTGKAPCPEEGPQRLSDQCFELPEGEAFRKLSIGRQAAAAGDYDIAAFAIVRAANGYRLGHRPLMEVFALVELATIYHQQRLHDRLQVVARRAKGVMKRAELSLGQVAIVQLAVELIENGAGDPESLEIFTACWAVHARAAEGS